MAFPKCFALLVLAVVPLAIEAGSWAYDGAHNPSEWYQHYPDCAKGSQSPIDIPWGSCDYGLDFKLYGVYNQMTVRVANNGHSVQANLPKNAGVYFYIDGTQYIVEQFHFHWGQAWSGMGSEHTVGGYSYPLEAHVVAYDSQYKDVTDAADKRGLAVLGVFFNEGGANGFLNNLAKMDLSKSSSHGGATHAVDNFSFYDLLGDTLHYGYYRYSGSLTTPGCYEGVTWTVFRNPQSVSSQQLSKFRDQTGVAFNYRPVQQLNRRRIECV